MRNAKLLLKVYKNQVHFQLLEQKAIVKETIQNRDNYKIALDKIITEFTPRAIELILDSDDTECELSSIQQFSLFNRYLHKKHLKKTNNVKGQILLGPHTIHRTFYNKGEETEFHSEKTMISTIVTFSDLSKQIIEQIKSYNIPIQKIDILENKIIQETMSYIEPDQIKTDWICMLIDHEGSINMAVCLRQYLIMFRSITIAPPLSSEHIDQIQQEIVHTFHYLSRIGYKNGESITVFYPEILSLIQESRINSLAEKLNCSVTPILIPNAHPNAKKMDRNYIYNELKAYQYAFSIPKMLKSISYTISFISIFMIAHNIHSSILQKSKKVEICSQNNLTYSFPLSSAEFSQIMKVDQQEKIAMQLWNYSLNQSWEETHFTEILNAFFTAAHKKKFLLNLKQEIPLSSQRKHAKHRSNDQAKNIKLKAELSPVSLYQEKTNKKTNKKIVQAACKESMDLIKKKFQIYNNQTSFKIKTKTSGQKIVFDVLFSPPSSHKKIKKTKRKLQKAAFHAEQALTISNLINSY